MTLWRCPKHGDVELDPLSDGSMHPIAGQADRVCLIRCERVVEAAPTARRIVGVRSWHVPTAGSLIKSELSIVLVAGAIDDCAAYVGVGSPEWVAAHGNKLPLDDARAFFPSIDPARYRP